MGLYNRSFYLAYDQLGVDGFADIISTHDPIYMDVAGFNVYRDLNRLGNIAIGEVREI